MVNPNRPLTVLVSGLVHKVLIDAEGHLYYDGNPTDVELSRREGGLVRLRMGETYYNVIVEPIDRSAFRVWVKDRALDVTVEDELHQLLMRLHPASGASRDELDLRAPMPGLVSKIHKREGDRITLGDPLIVLEAMKMENELRSPTNGTILKVHAVERSTVDKDQCLLTIAPTSHRDNIA